MISIHELHQLIHDLDITLLHHDGEPKAWYSHIHRAISTKRGMAIWDYKSSLAHELGHAIYRDRRTNHAHYDQIQERRADEFAAELLIDENEIRDALLWHRNDLDSLAVDLEVTPHLLGIYLKMNPHLLKEEAA